MMFVRIKMLHKFYFSDRCIQNFTLNVNLARQKITTFTNKTKLDMKNESHHRGFSGLIRNYFATITSEQQNILVSM